MLLQVLLSATLLAPPKDADLLMNDRATTCYVRLMAQAGWGWRLDERAAFLVRGLQGLECVEWNSRLMPMRARFEGRIPNGTVAIVHTHPAKTPDPSAGDVAEAQRLGIPFLVITPNAIFITRDGEISSLTTRARWYE